MKIIAIIAVLLSAGLLLASCSREPSDSEKAELYNSGYNAGHQAGHDEGYRQGASAGNAEGQRVGFDQGFKAVFPPGTPGYLPSGGLFGKIIAAIGALFVIVDIAVFIGLMISRSKHDYERIAKFLMIFAGALGAYFVAPLSGVSFGTAWLFLLPAPRWSWVALILAGIVSYLIARGMERIWPRIHGMQVEGWCAFMAAALLALLGQVFLRILFVTPQLENYLAPHILIGILLGGMIYWSQRLFRMALESTRPARQVRAIPKSKAATRSAMASDEVRPGDSMP
jgi:hypothetical protein